MTTRCHFTHNMIACVRGIQGPEGSYPILNYACFTSNTNQDVANVNEPTPISYSTTEIASANVAYNGNNEIVFTTSGIFKIGCSPEFDYTSGNKVKGVYMWFRKNFEDIPNSASYQVVADKDAETYTYVEIITGISAGDNIQCFFASEEASMRLAAFSANSAGFTHPAVPSVILTIQQIA